MDWIVPTVALGAATATATTFDDNIYLTMFFSKTNRTFRPRQIVVGEVVGFTGLVAISLVGYFAGLMIPYIWIGLLSFLPIAIGVNALLSCQTMAEDDSVDVSVANPTNPHYRQVRRQSLWHTLRDPQTYKVSAVTLANGGNNIAI
jgi:cadmium resistance protein CadD (predicted permease)